MSLRATRRLLSVDKDTVHHWLPVLGRPCQGVMHSFFRHLHLRECQLDELWTFVAKKKAHLTPLEKLATLYGDAWVWIACSPGDKLVPAWVVGKRTLRDARRLVLRLPAATDGHIMWSKYSNVAFSKAFHPALALSQWCEQSTIFMGAARALPLEMLGWRGRLQGFR
jgi:IS1 family transposase